MAKVRVITEEQLQAFIQSLQAMPGSIQSEEYDQYTDHYIQELIGVLVRLPEREE